MFKIYILCISGWFLICRNSWVVALNLEIQASLSLAKPQSCSYSCQVHPCDCRPVSEGTLDIVEDNRNMLTLKIACPFLSLLNY